MTTALIPCTALILTRNSGETIGACLDSLRLFADVILLDGRSTDATRSIAQTYPNVRFLEQPAKYLDANGRITNFAAVRNVGIAAATYAWIAIVDSDESVPAFMMDEVRAIVTGDPGVYEIRRRFYIDGQRIEQSALYPSLQIRLFHRSLTTGFVKSVHERLHLLPGIQKRLMQAELRTSLPPPQYLLSKYERYLRMEVDRVGRLSWWRWVRWVLMRNLCSVTGLLLRILRIWLIPHTGTRMPLTYDLMYVRHSLRTIWFTCPFRRYFHH